MNILDGGFRFEATFGALQGAVAKEIFDRFVEAERTKDWDDARKFHGDDTNVGHLARTEPQRRADAFIAMILQAAATRPDAIRPEPALHIVMTTDAYETALAELAGTPAQFDPRRYQSYKSETLDGIQIDPSDALAAGIIGHIRRVVIGVTEASMSQKARVFTGPLRKLLGTLDPVCIWPGCELPQHLCQADHTVSWRETQDTSVGNGKIMCGKHNRLKETGYRTWKDPTGHWHTYRPDGTEIIPAA